MHSGQRRFVDGDLDFINKTDVGKAAVLHYKGFLSLLDGETSIRISTAYGFCFFIFISLFLENEKLR